MALAGSSPVGADERGLRHALAGREPRQLHAFLNSSGVEHARRRRQRDSSALGARVDHETRLPLGTRIAGTHSQGRVGAEQLSPRAATEALSSASARGSGGVLRTFSGTRARRNSGITRMSGSALGAMKRMPVCAAGTALAGRHEPACPTDSSSSRRRSGRPGRSTGRTHCGRRPGPAGQAAGSRSSAWNARRRELREIEGATERMARLRSANMAKMMGLMCVADSKLGESAEGQRPSIMTGDDSEVVVLAAERRIIPWRRVARFDAAEIGRTRREIVGKLFRFLWNMEEPELAALRDHRRDETSEWRRPRKEFGLKQQMDGPASGIVGIGARPGTTGGRDAGLNRIAGPCGGAPDRLP